MPARVKCAELAWRTLEEMLEAGSEEASVAVPFHTHEHDGAND